MVGWSRGHSSCLLVVVLDVWNLAGLFSPTLTLSLDDPYIIVGHGLVGCFCFHVGDLECWLEEPIKRRMVENCYILVVLELS